MSSDTAAADGAKGYLTPDQIAQFHRDGYLLLPSFFDPAPLLAHSKSLISSFSLADHPLTTFSAGEDESHVGDRYFLDSGDKIRHFFEEGAIDPITKTLTVDKDKAINKCGHGLHLLDPVFRDFSFSPQLQGVARSLGVHKDPRVLQSMVICKQPSIGGAVPSHNDSTFLYTDPPSAVGFWFALEDCTTSNGCLSFLPGSHRWPKGTSPSPSDAPRPADAHNEALGTARGINKRFVRKQPSNPDAGTTFISIAQNEEVEWDESKAEIAECKAGTLVLIHGSVMHKSEKNLSDRSRFIYTFHMIEGEGARYDEKNWLQPTQKHPFPRLYDGA
ncbi:Phytanoyl-CoA dioxygenase [Kalmanozyma brasiliensis GHG001]|uniref:Phytanoyl-CoA dioxygenase n=1 Tax=Kalmanozyma brasiliensis (strain GHG001) TaxID=1365824 RepID=V5ER70_KALBG|nr:Phytanoyl-CoA dioxygenase [Kalmanozyma brasiliensis GHG001]EST05443.1 Phytanoyl-CoA dioxygenase [Kalmanozyma brasiliensis GHG001]